MRRRGYGQFCPVAKAAEIIGERWTLLLLRELLGGNRRFSELRRGIPQISPTMLSQRLREHEESGLIVKRRAGGHGPWEYALTEAGRDLGPIIEEMGAWGRRWVLAALRRADLEPAYLMWAAYRNVSPTAFGDGRMVIAFELTDAPPNKQRWWLVVEDGEVDLCLKRPAFPLDLTVRASAHTLALLCLGNIAPEEAVRSGAVSLRGAPELARQFATWCPRGRIADIAQLRSSA